MKLSSYWVYRNIHGFNLLININNNDILKVSPLLGMLFSRVKLSNIDNELSNWSKENKVDEEKLEKVVDYFKAKGVFVDE